MTIEAARISWQRYAAFIALAAIGCAADLITKGWVFGGKGGAAGKVGDTGASVDEIILLDGRMKVFAFTEKGLIAGVSVRGAKVWPDDRLY